MAATAQRSWRLGSWPAPTTENALALELVQHISSPYQVRDPADEPTSPDPLCSISPRSPPQSKSEVFRQLREPHWHPLPKMPPYRDEIKIGSETLTRHRYRKGKCSIRKKMIPTNLYYSILSEGDTT